MLTFTHDVQPLIVLQISSSKIFEQKYSAEPFDLQVSHNVFFVNFGDQSHLLMLVKLITQNKIHDHSGGINGKINQ